MPAHTEDIPEKVASLLLNEAAQFIPAGYDVSKKLAKGAGSLTKKTYQKIRGMYDDHVEMKNFLGIKGEVTAVEMSTAAQKLGLATYTFTVRDSDVDDFEKLLRQNEVMYAKVAIKNDDAKMFMFLADDRQRVEDLGEILTASRGEVTEVSPNLYFNSMAPENVRLVEGLNLTELELFRSYAREEGLLFTTIQRGDKSALVFSRDDEYKYRRAMLHTAWDLTGPLKDLNREQVEHHLKGYSAVYYAIENGNRDLHIVSKNNPNYHLHIHAEGFTLYDQNGDELKQVGRDSPFFKNECQLAAEGIGNAVALTEFEYHPDITRKELERYRSIDLHRREYDILIEMQRQNTLIDLISKKYSLDDEHSDTWGIHDQSVSYSEFAGYEFIMDEEEKEARTYEFEHFKDAAFYAQGRFNVQDIHLDEKNVDFVIEKAKQKQKQQSGPEYSRDTKEPEKDTGVNI